MHHSSVTRSRWLLPTVRLIVALAGAVGLASIPDAGNVIHGCYFPLTGILRVIDTGATAPQHCFPGETSLSWNQKGPAGEAGLQGPQGPMGFMGPQGPAGPAGPAGASSATFAYGTGVKLGEPGTYTLVARTTLPPGSWVLQANVRVYYGTAFSGAEGDEQTDCQLRKNGTGVLGWAVDSRVFKGDGHAMLPMNGGIFVEPGGAAFADVWCRDAVGGKPADAQMVAIQIGGFF